MTLVEPAPRTRREDPQVLLVEQGMVSCPLHGKADVEECFLCGWMTESHLAENQPSLRCIARHGAFFGDRTAFFRG